jgi:hypothetical protein
MAFDVAPLLCPFTVTLNIFMLNRDIAKMHCNNVGLNVLGNAPMVIYQTDLARHWLVMGLKIDNSLVDARLSKMEATIENIASLAIVGKPAVNQLMEREAAAVITTKVAFAEEPK